MILVGRPSKVPKSLAKGVAVNAANCAALDARPNEAISGVLKFSFPKSIYGSRATKNAFAAAQYQKCCFCEGVFDAHYRGDVEHFRPKAAITIEKRKVYPGYYWLAFEFDNLFFACADCNQYRKRGLFPLLNEQMRARSHHDQIANEDPLILSPIGPHDPRQHIRFYNDVPVGISDRGWRTIDSLRLDREPLNKRRRALIKQLKKAQRTIALHSDDMRPDVIDEVGLARADLVEAVSPFSEFSAAAQDFLVGWSPP